MERQQSPFSDASGREPLFVIGTGRCGSTLFHDLLTRHPQVTFMTALTNRHPNAPFRNQAAVACMDVPGLSSVARRKWFPVEAYTFWDRFYRGFSAPCRDLTAGDASVAAAKKLRAATAGLVSARRPRLICKITGWPRIGFLQAVYPQAKFISVIRDGRATANSLLQVHFWDGWQGPHKWAWGPLSAEHEKRWEKFDRSFVALAGLQWEILMDSYARAKAAMPDPGKLLEVRYEDLCADPARVMGRAAEFAGLDFSGEFERGIRQLQLHAKNDKWREDLTPIQQDVLNGCLADSLARWGYADDSVPASAQRPVSLVAPATLAARQRNLTNVAPETMAL